MPLNIEEDDCKKTQKDKEAFIEPLPIMTSTDKDRIDSSSKNIIVPDHDLYSSEQSKIQDHTFNFFSPSDKTEFSVRCRIVFKGLNRKNKIAKYYFFVDLNRHLLLALVVSQLYDYPMTQILLLELICLIFLVFLIILKQRQICIYVISMNLL